MKLSIQRDALSKALSIVTRVIQTKGAVEVLEHVLVRAEPGQLVLTGADLEMRMSVVVDAAVEAVGVVTMPASTLSEYTNRLPAGASIDIELAEDGQRVSLKSKRSRASLGGLNPSIFPALTVPEIEHGFEIEGRIIARLLASVDFAIEVGGGYLALGGVSLRVGQGAEGPRLQAAATDGKRVGRASAPCPRSADGLPDVILSKRVVAEVRKIAEAADSDPVSIAFAQTQMQVVAGKTTLAASLIDAVFPDLDRVIPRFFDKVVLADGADFRAALSRSAIVADDKYRSSRFTFSSGAIEIVSRSDKAGDIVETIDAEYDGPDFSLSLNSKFARDILGVLDSDTVRISCGPPGTPTLWVSPADAAREYVLMPLIA